MSSLALQVWKKTLYYLPITFKVIDDTFQNQSFGLNLLKHISSCQGRPIVVLKLAAYRINQSGLCNWSFAWTIQLSICSFASFEGIDVFIVDVK